MIYLKVILCAALMLAPFVPKDQLRVPQLLIAWFLARTAACILVVTLL